MGTPRMKSCLFAGIGSFLPARLFPAPHGLTPHAQDEPTARLGRFRGGAGRATQRTSRDGIRTRPLLRRSPPLRSAAPGAAEVSASPPADLTGQTVYVVDAHSLIYQVFHAIPEMTGPSGQPVAAIHGFVRDVLDLLEKKRPDYLFCAFDGPGDDNYRLQLYPEYKANRPSMPADLQLQIPNIRRMLEALAVPCLQAPGFEADDILASLARETAERGGTCVLVTADKDCRQLIGERVQLLNIRKNQLWMPTACGGNGAFGQTRLSTINHWSATRWIMCRACR